MINPNLDIPGLVATFRQKSRIQIHDVLLADIAEKLYQCLAHEVPWGIAYIEGEKSVLLKSEQVAGFTPTDWTALNNAVQARALQGKFQFIYGSYMMITAYKEKRDPQLMLHSMVELINSPPFLSLLRIITGIHDIVKADAQATRYIPGNFLTKHNDIADNQNRKIAYVLNLTKDWQADWGGLLQFMDDSGMITDTYAPVFNSLSLFRVPMWHHVSYVSPFATHARYAITGWGIGE